MPDVPGVYLHCGRCVREQRPNSLAVWTDGEKIKLRCEFHDAHIVTLDLVPGQLKLGPHTCDAPDCKEKHDHG